MKIRKEKLLKLIGVLIILFILINFIPTNYFIVSPGIARELSPMITVENGYKGEEKGSFMLTAVASQRATVWDYIYVTITKPAGVDLTQMGEQLPPGMDMQKYIEIMGELMEESKLKAQAVAFRKAGYDVKVSGEGARVVEVLESGSARGKLKNGDIIIGIDEKEVEFATDAVNLIRKHKIGDKVEIKVLRDGKKLTFELETVEIENSPGQASIGVMITTKNLDYSFPRTVTFHTDNIVGPSAGGIFTLEIYNQLISEDITGGKEIAGTGTISLDGSIGKIDGVTQKIIAAQKSGADLFIVPEENYEKASKAADKLKLISVKNIDEVIDYLSKSNIKNAA